MLVDTLACLLTASHNMPAGDLGLCAVTASLESGSVPSAV